MKVHVQWKKSQSGPPPAPLNMVTSEFFFLNKMVLANMLYSRYGYTEKTCILSAFHMLSIKDEQICIILYATYALKRVEPESKLNHNSNVKPHQTTHYKEKRVFPHKSLL